MRVNSSIMQTLWISSQCFAVSARFNHTDNVLIWQVFKQLRYLCTDTCIKYITLFLQFSELYILWTPLSIILPCAMMFSSSQCFQAHCFDQKWGTEYSVPNSFSHNVEWILNYILEPRFSDNNKPCSDQTCSHSTHPILSQLWQQQIWPAALPQDVCPMWRTQWTVEPWDPVTTITTCCRNSHPAITRATPQHWQSQ
jgi:hypothetical protein